MEAALKHFELDVTGMTCLDAGLSTGGFTDCLLQKGAVKVYGVDVGAGQVSKPLLTKFPLQQSQSNCFDLPCLILQLSQLTSTSSPHILGRLVAWVSILASKQQK